MIVDTTKTPTERRLKQEQSILFFQNLLKFADEIFAEVNENKLLAAGESDE